MGKNTVSSNVILNDFYFIDYTEDLVHVPPFHQASIDRLSAFFDFEKDALEMASEYVSEELGESGGLWYVAVAFARERFGNETDYCISVYVRKNNPDRFGEETMERLNQYAVPHSRPVFEEDDPEGKPGESDIYCVTKNLPVIYDSDDPEEVSAMEALFAR